MYECFSCGLIFEEPEDLFDHHGWDFPPYERLWVCPSCKSDDIAEEEDND